MISMFDSLGDTGGEKLGASHSWGGGGGGESKGLADNNNERVS